MNRFLISLCLLFLLYPNLSVLAQVEEPIQLKTDAFTLNGTLTLPADVKGPVPVVLLLAGSGPTDRDGNSSLGLKTNVYRILADSLVRQGMAVARYDKRGAGASQVMDRTKVRLADGLFDAGITDAVGFARQLQADSRFSKVIIAGHSEGSQVGMVAARQTRADGFVSIAGIGRNIADVMKAQFEYALPDSLKAEASRILDSLRVGRTVPKANPILMTVFRPSVQPYLISWMKHDPTADLKAYPGPVLIVQGTNDFQVPVSEAQLLKAARPDAQLVLISDMTHMLRTYAGTNRAENIKTYTALGQPLTAGLATAIVRFVNQL
ncbi:alpha/beta fold hydrolase [Spirosoma taeanense]|uniref:Alpha/beta fold hydrolase n=1 Tax=Spirosoma taeanense TaxID=2735870 RepID=A0A6M5Y4D3_9BACT|nr:alpha/beta fold hydrolase [Spirosoma taeanense]QJW89398.1 alpha/beta fold hydrolase [Spirosoma taeanense]